jgi:hypothetical protein
MCFRGHLSPHGFWRSACTRSAGQQSPRPNSSLGRRGAGSGTTASSGRSRHRTWTSVVLDFKPHRTHLRRLSSGRRKARRMSIPAANLLSPADWYRTIRDQIQHEDNLIVQRLSWLMAAQSFFFTGYAIIANASPQARSPLLAKQQDLLFNIIPAVACISDILIFCSVIAGVLALGRLRRAYAAHVDAVGGFPEIHASRLIRALGMGSPILLPLVFLIAWLILWSKAHL